MRNPEPAAPSRPPLCLWAGFLSYLVPGLGQIVQGRVGKGLLFLFCLYGLFFYGLYLGSWSNVYIPRTDRPAAARLVRLPLVGEVRLANGILDLWDRLQFPGQFWMGAVVWPAIWQYVHHNPAAPTGPLFGNFMREPYENRTDAPPGWQGKTLNELQIDGDKTWDLGWVMTVIAGVLNVLVIYDAYAGPALGPTEPKPTEKEAA